jgi:hypothetical protein
MMSRIIRAIVVLPVLATAGCAALGYTDRVLWRVPSPDGQLVAVCQEVPAFDGPGYDIRLERPDGSLVRPLYDIGDGDPCTEVTWSADGRVLGVMSGHVARIRFVDVAWALGHPETRTAYWSWRQVDLSTDRILRSGRNLHFVHPGRFQLELCPAAIAGDGSGVKCAGPALTRAYDIPLPIVTGH